MAAFDQLDTLFAAWAFFVQIVFIVHFACRKRYFKKYTLKYGWVVYALAVPAVVISIILLKGGKEIHFWLAGFFFAAFSYFGYQVDYSRRIEWRRPPRYKILLPYTVLYLGMIMFYWWPLALIARPLWYAYAVLFAFSTCLNIKSH